MNVRVARVLLARSLVIAMALLCFGATHVEAVFVNYYPTGWYGPFTPLTDWAGEHDTNTTVEIQCFKITPGPNGYGVSSGVWVSVTEGPLPGHFSASHPDYIYGGNTYYWRVKEYNAVTGAYLGATAWQSYSLWQP